MRMGMDTASVFALTSTRHYLVHVHGVNMGIDLYMYIISLFFIHVLLLLYQNAYFGPEPAATISNSLASY